MFDLVFSLLLVLMLIALILEFLWINHLANVVNAQQQRIDAMEQRAAATAADPVANAKFL